MARNKLARALRPWLEAMNALETQPLQLFSECLKLTEAPNDGGLAAVGFALERVDGIRKEPALDYVRRAHPKLHLAGAVWRDGDML